MKTICFYFQIHQPIRLKRYRFFSMGRDHQYLDDAGNRAITQKVASRCYLPMNNLLLKLIKEHNGAFRVSFSMSGLAVEQFKAYAPEVMDSFRALADTGCVEFLGETYSHSLSSLWSREEFCSQVVAHSNMIKREFKKTPKAFRNTELIYSDQIGEWIGELGFRTMLAEGAKHVLGWKSPDFVYANALNQKLRLMLRNYKMSDDIALRFSDRHWSQWPLTADKFAGWMAHEGTPGSVINLFMDYETFGESQSADTGIFDFMAHLPKAALATGRLEFGTVSEAAAKHQPVAVLSCPHPMSWADEERDTNLWLGNELQSEAFNTLNAQRDKVLAVGDSDMIHVWNLLQCSDHLFYMSTKVSSNSDAQSYFNPYDSTYDAFINYMNVLSDFIVELDKRLVQAHVPVTA